LTELVLLGVSARLQWEVLAQLLVVAAVLRFWAVEVVAWLLLGEVVDLPQDGEQALLLHEQVGACQFLQLPG